jgi:hypothetical protein
MTMSRAVIDPVVYGVLRAREAHLELPSIGEEGYARDALGKLFALVDDCPLFVRLSGAKKRGYVRHYIDSCLKDINSIGFIPAIVAWAKFGNLFNRSFKKVDGKLTYELDAELTASPFFLAMHSLTKITEDEPILFFSTVRWIETLHMFLAKIPLDRTDLVEPAQQAWIMRQLMLVDVSTIPQDYICALRYAISWLYNAELPETLHGKHGPGAVATRRVKTVSQKENDYVATIQTSQIVDRKYHLFKGSPHKWGFAFSRALAMRRRPRRGRLEFVKKDAKSLRSITLEPPETQYNQQAIKREMYYAVDNEMVHARRFVKFSDQRFSQRLAVEGSRLSADDTTPATIDLKDSSDSLSVDVVSSVFSGDLLHALMCTRSWEVDTEYGPIEVRMFGGMGSATTFPVQTLVFTGIALVATLAEVYIKQFGYLTSYVDAVREYLSMLNVWSDPTLALYLSKIRVYGDDIIIPELSVARTLNLLKAFGLKVNTDKSFTSELAVREACGTYALAGYDITPVRYRIPVYNTDGHADYAVFEAYRSLANLAFCAGFCSLNRSVIRSYKGLVPLVREDDAKKVLFHSNGMKARLVDVSLDGETHVREIRRGNTERLKLCAPSVLYEEYKGDNAAYLGIISTRDVLHQCFVGTLWGEPRLMQTSYLGVSSSTVDRTTERYHLDQALFQALKQDLPEAHGRIPRGISLRRRIAYRLADESGWAWAPSSS